MDEEFNFNYWEAIRQYEQQGYTKEEAENKEIMADLATARKVIDAKNRLLEEHKCRIGKLQEVIKDIIDKI